MAADERPSYGVHRAREGVAAMEVGKHGVVPTVA